MIADFVITPSISDIWSLQKFEAVGLIVWLTEVAPRGKRLHVLDRVSKARAILKEHSSCALIRLERRLRGQRRESEQ